MYYVIVIGAAMIYGFNEKGFSPHRYMKIIAEHPNFISADAMKKEQGLNNYFK